MLELGKMEATRFAGRPRQTRCDTISLALEGEYSMKTNGRVAMGALTPVRTLTNKTVSVL
jgi:hypothetical protein